MEYVNLGKTGLKVSRLCLGCMSYGEVPAVIRPGSHAWALNEEQSQPFFKQALDFGINFWDTANVYSLGSSEELVGKFLKANTKRENMVIATKLNGVMRDDPNGKGLSRKEIFFELDQSLQRLQTDYVDLYQIHRWDYETPIEETLEALHDVVKSGKVRYIGASSMFAWQFAKALYTADVHGWTRFISMQNHYNLIYREEEREMMKLWRRGGDRGDSVEPTGAREADTAVGRGGDQAVGDGPVQQGDLLEDRGSRQEGGRPAGRGSREARGSASDAGAGLVAEQAGGYFADRGRDEAKPSHRCCDGVAGEAGCRGDRIS